MDAVYGADGTTTAAADGSSISSGGGNGQAQQQGQALPNTADIGALGGIFGAAAHIAAGGEVPSAMGESRTGAPKPDFALRGGAWTARRPGSADPANAFAYDGTGRASLRLTELEAMTLEPVDRREFLGEAEGALREGGERRAKLQRRVARCMVRTAAAALLLCYQRLFSVNVWLALMHHPAAILGPACEMTISVHSGSAQDTSCTT